MLETSPAPPVTMIPTSLTPSPQHAPSSYHSSRPSTSSLPRSYKRVKSTPSPQSPILHHQTSMSGSSGQPGPSRAKPRATVARRLIEASPQARRLDGGRRREMSVPLLSRELSHFSLSHSSPPESNHGNSTTTPLATQPFLTSPAQVIQLSRPASFIGQAKTPSSAAVIKDHTYPSTAPLPQVSSFLGSPFSTKTARGRYVYHDVSPSTNANKIAVTERIGGRDSFDESGLEWLENNDGLPLPPRRGSKEGKQTMVEGLPQGMGGSGRLRRGTKGSTSSMDELSGSGASTASLLSLARNSMEQHSRPNIITVWDEVTYRLDEEDEGAPTPSRQLFANIDSHMPLQMSSKASKPLRTSDQQVKTAARPFLPRSAGGKPQQSCKSSGSSSVEKIDQDKQAFSPSKTGRSPLSNFLPRLLKKVSQQSLRRSFIEPGSEDMLTDTEESTSTKGSLREKTKTLWSRTRSITSARNPMEGGDHESSLGAGIGLGIRRGMPLNKYQRHADTGIDLSRSLSSDSSGDVETSPSRPFSARSSSSLFVKPSLPVAPSFDAKASDRSAFLARRKSVTGQNNNTPDHHLSNGLRSARDRPVLRRGITAPATHSASSTSHLSVESAFNTPTHILFGDIKPSPAAFASTGLVKKKSGLPRVEIPKFGGGTESEPVGEVKREQAAIQHGMLRTLELPSPISPIKPVHYPRPGLTATSTSTSISSSSATASTTSSNAAYIQIAQKTRGLRRKGSQMFNASGSIGSVDMMRSDSNRSARGGISPATPTKPGLQITPMGLGVTTPSPTGHHILYPFASTTSLSTPPHSSVYAPLDTVEPSSIERYNMPARVRQITNSHASDRGPLARASNPMLANGFKASASIHTVPESPVQCPVPSINLFNGPHKARSKRETTRLEKDFTVIQTLGSGAFSQVLKVCERSSGKLYAVKAGKPYTGVKNRLRQLEEVSILRQLSLTPHENVITYIDSWESASRLFIRTSLSECGDLSKFLGLLGDFGGLGEERVWKSLIELASGLTHIHENNFLHLDLKPSNILINRDGGLVIADLGMAVICSNDSKGQILEGLSPALPEKDDQGGFIWQTSASTGAATPDEKERRSIDLIPSPIIDREFEGDREYLCPEALSGQTIGKGADIFSLGMVVLEAAVNVVLPSNGEGWLKLRHDDFSDLNEHYRLRSLTNSFTPTSTDEMTDASIPLLSNELIQVVKGMMKSDSSQRWELEDIWENRIVKKIIGGKRGKALVEEEQGWLDNVLKQ
ncbi:uncharacterized protein I206_105277 [Kwoniella pini CBS 10737]|uniref:WEE/WEE-UNCLASSIFIED protein kinase n=1 Tax=Kwoniella pini CBS 10737 TaxID=1296096 RepID=A0A1B9I4N9_9TREE|nr:WEE/WEE-UNCLASSIFIED protein kinase [Kwoniella pini CBS 10737]OCF50490.1 WEE/WEE-UNCLASSIFIED protein kinase [Kwoniella pini CBS 10737]